MLKKKVCFFIITMILLIVVATSIVSATEDNISIDNYESDKLDVESSNYNIEEESIIESDNNLIDKKSSSDVKTSQYSDKDYSIELNVSVVNTTTDLIYDMGNEVVINKNITPVNGVVDVSKLGIDYAYADEEGVYTILGSEIRRVMKLDSYCQQIYGFVPKYTFFRDANSNVKYIISREKWNVIARSLHSYHVNQGYTSVNTPYAITVNLSGKSRHYCVYYDAQEWIDGHQYTCGPTAMSMISQALNCYASERKLAGIYLTTASDGTSESSIIKYSPSIHMKLTNIENTKSSVKSTLLSGKMVFWHIRGHYMCVISYNKNNDKFLCLNPSGPSHNIDAVQWANWTEMMNTDYGLKDNGFMSVMAYWNLTSSDKTQAKYYYYNMGGKYTVAPNSEYCNDENDNEVKVTVNTPTSIPKTTNKTSINIYSAFGKKVSGNYNVTVYVNNNQVNKASSINNTLKLNYTLPAYIPKNVNVTLLCKSINKNKDVNLSLTFNKYSAGKTYTKNTLLNFESISVDDITAKKDDKIKFTAYVTDVLGNPVNNGKVVFKLNGVTLKQNDSVAKIRVVNGTASLDFTVPAYSAKNYRLTAVYGNDSTRLESNATLVIKKLDTKIINAKLEESNSTLLLTAKVVDKYYKNVERETKITIKINSKTVVNKVKVVDGIIKMKIDLTIYKTGSHNISILAGENGVYKFSSLNMTFNKTSTSTSQQSTHITGLNYSIKNNKLNITASIADKNNNKINKDVKLTVKINSKTVINKAIIKKGIINKTVDLTDYKIGTYLLTLITGSTRTYQSTAINSTFTIN